MHSWEVSLFCGLLKSRIVLCKFPPSGEPKFNGDGVSHGQRGLVDFSAIVELF